MDLVVPVKELRRAKSRLAAAVADLPGTDADRTRAHRGLALALARDTLRAATAAAVRRVVVVTAEPAGLLGVTREGTAGDATAGVEIVDDPDDGLNAAIRHGIEYLRRTARGRPGLVAVLQADLPALRPAELDAALARAAAVIAGGADAALVADHVGTGTTLLVGAPGRVLRPCFGVGSAGAHAAAGPSCWTGRGRGCAPTSTPRPTSRASWRSAPGRPRAPGPGPRPDPTGRPR